MSMISENLGITLTIISFFDAPGLLTKVSYKASLLKVLVRALYLPKLDWLYFAN